MNCSKCDRALAGKSYYQEMTGYAKSRGATGGTNHLLHRRATGKLLCEACIHTIDKPKQRQDQLAL